jgi:N-acetylglucosamine kinase-like BadF-type ATPase
MTYAAIDVGGSASRMLLSAESGSPEVTIHGPSLKVGRRGIAAGPLIAALANDLEERRTRDGREAPRAVVIGMSGLLGLVDLPGDIVAAVYAIWPGVRIAVASDATTALVGAVGLEGGVVVAAGTGVIGLGSNLRGVWHRVDGWGHLLGDEGGGAWVGIEGLKAALRSFDGRPGGSNVLLAAATTRFGPASALPRLIYTRSDRAKILASFAPDVLRASEEGDCVATDIWSRAAQNLAQTAFAALIEGVPRRVCLVGGIRCVGDAVLLPFQQAVLETDGVEVMTPLGDPLAGAALLAATLEHDPSRVPDRPPFIMRGM